VAGRTVATRAAALTPPRAPAVADVVASWLTDTWTSASSPPAADAGIAALTTTQAPASAARESEETTGSPASRRPLQLASPTIVNVGVMSPAGVSAVREKVSVPLPVFFTVMARSTLLPGRPVRVWPGSPGRPLGVTATP